MIKLELSTSMQPEMTPITSSGWCKCVSNSRHVFKFLPTVSMTLKCVYVTAASFSSPYTSQNIVFIRKSFATCTCCCVSVSSSERLPWTAQGSHTSWSTRCSVDLTSIPAETLSSRCSTGPCPRSWTLSQVHSGNLDLKVPSDLRVSELKVIFTGISWIENESVLSRLRM